MGWSNTSLPAMQIEAHFGDRLIPVFQERPRSVWEMIAAAGRRNPDGEAIVFGDERLTWRETVRRSSAIAAGLQNLGLQPGDRLAVLVGNRTEFVLALYAAAQLGVIAVLLSTRLQKPEVAYMLTDCAASAIISSRRLISGSSMRFCSCSMLPVMTVRRLLKSCATPLVSWPTASSLWAWRSAVSTLSRSAIWVAS